jgi:hypothetical protein
LMAGSFIPYAAGVAESTYPFWHWSFLEVLLCLKQSKSREAA